MLMLDPATGTALVNPLLRTDSYKISHPDQYPPGTTELMTYVESRGGPHPGTIFFGLQIFAEQLAATRISHAMIAEARAFFRAHFGGADFFRADDWAYVVDRYEGRIPVEDPRRSRRHVRAAGTGPCHGPVDGSTALLDDVVSRDLAPAGDLVPDDGRDTQ